MSLDGLFADATYKLTMQKYCANHGWKIADLNDRRMILKFNMESGRTQTLYVIRYETTLEFSVPSMLNFASENELPHQISTLLLRRNMENKIGFWCIEKIGEKFVYSYMHNAEMQLIDNEYFGRVVMALIGECDKLEGLILQLLKS